MEPAGSNSLELFRGVCLSVFDMYPAPLDPLHSDVQSKVAYKRSLRSGPDIRGDRGVV
jgi:hypothetical protein